EADMVLVPAGVVPRLVVPAGRAQDGRVDLLLGHQHGVRGAVGNVGDPPALFDGGGDRLRRPGVAPLTDEHALAALARHVPAAVAGVVAPAAVGVEGRLPAGRAVIDLDGGLGHGRVAGGGVGQVVHVTLLDERGDVEHPGPADAGGSVAAVGVRP